MKFVRKLILSSLTTIMLVSYPLKDVFAVTDYNVDNNQIDTYCMHPAVRYNCYGNVKYWVYGDISVHYYCYTAVECDLCGKYLRTEGSHFCYDVIELIRVDVCPY